MKSKQTIILLFLFLYSMSIYSQSYYWYDNTKIKLDIDSTKINVTTTIDVDLSSLLRMREFSGLDVKQIEKTKNNTLLFSVDLQSTKIYSNIVDYLKTIKEVISVSPYFKRGENNPIGTSSFFYIKLYKEDDYKLLSEFALRNNLKVVEQISYMSDWYIVSTMDSKINSIEASNIVYESGLFADVDPAFMFNFKPNCTNDPMFNQLWGLKNPSNPGININVCDAWTITRGAGIKVAVVDQPIDRNHNDLATNILSIFDSQNGGSTYNPAILSHGTHVAGTVAAIKDNNLQVVGVAPEAKIMGVSHDLYISSTISAELASGITWAWQNGADIITNSWGDQGGLFNSSLYSSALNNAIINAMIQGRGNKGAIVVFAAGNSSPVMDYPANFHNDILTVGSINSNGYRSSFSGHGNSLDVVAPGENILSTIPNNSTESESGTSMAAPHVAGVAALMLSANSNLTALQVRNIIESTARKVRTDLYSYSTMRPNGLWDNQMGYGLINAYEAVSKARTCWKYLHNVTINTNRTETGCVIDVQDAIVRSGTTLDLQATDKIIINGSFIIEAGAAFIIR